MEKTCTTCGVSKSLSDFFKSVKGLHGVRSKCKTCEVASGRERVAAWRVANKDEYHAHAKAWADRNPERYKNILKENFQKNKEAKLEYARKWTQENRARRNEVRRAWRETPERRASESAAASKWAKENREKSAANYSARRARKLQAIPMWADKSAIEMAYVLARQKTLATGVKWHVDHIVPLRGKTVCGLHVQQNLQVIEAHQNQRKSNVVWPDMP